MAEGGQESGDLNELEIQKRKISNLIETPLLKGESWYLLDNTKWLKQWKKYVGYDSWDTTFIGDSVVFPGPIDNSALLKEDGDLKEHLIDELDYVLVPLEALNLLKSWYGMKEGQEPISRKVVEYGMFVKHCKVEVYLMELKLCENSNLDLIHTHRFSRSDTIGKIEEHMRELFNIDKNKSTRLWLRYSGTSYDHLGDKEATAQDTCLFQGQILIIEQQNDDGTWSRSLKSTSPLSYSNNSTSLSDNSYSNSSNTNVISTRYGSLGRYNSSDYESNGSCAIPGVCGLINLGNTCFMNSAIQCMSNTRPVAEYFLKDKFWDEVNVDNPLGMRGEIAKSFGELIKGLWSGKCSHFSPRNFKMQLGRFAPQFSGYQQHDTQEMMAFLIDGLHEDLNRIKKKPYIELKDSDNRPDSVVAKEAWDNYQLRNHSIIVDIFHGLLKSTLVCPECSKVSITFDPFCYLSLPLPMKKERQIEVFYVSINPNRKIVQYKLAVPKFGNVEDLKRAMSSYTGVPVDKLLVTEVYNHQIFRIFQSSEAIDCIRDRDKTYIYEVPVSSHDHTDTIAVCVYLKEKLNSTEYSKSALTFLWFGLPFYVLVPRKNCSYDTLYRLIMKQMSRYVREPSENEEWMNEEQTDTVNGAMELSNGDSLNEDSDSDGNNSMQDTSEKKKENKRLFIIQKVDDCDNADIDDLNEDSPFQFENENHLAISWSGLAIEKFYSKKSAEEFDQHESMSSKVLHRQAIQLGECLDLFTTTEKLGSDDLWYCPSCKMHQEATKKFDLWSLPNVLVIHLKRFSYNRFWRDKLDTRVEFPIEGLNMAKFIIDKNHGPAIYDLVAVSNHYGGMGGGHYTAYGKNKDDGNWYHFDDSSVSPINAEDVVSGAAYVLFYQRRDCNVRNMSLVNNNPQISNKSSKVPAAAGSADQIISDKCDGDVNMDTN